MPVVLALKDVEADALGRLLPRISARLTRELKKHEPSLERVTLSREGGAIVPSISGAFADEESERRILARARELWDTRGESLAAIRL